MSSAEFMGGFRPQGPDRGGSRGAENTRGPLKRFEQTYDLKGLGLFDVQPTTGVQPSPEDAFKDVVARLDAAGIQARSMRGIDVRTGQFGMQLDLSEADLRGEKREEHEAQVQRRVATTIVESLGLGDKLHRVPGWGEERTLFVPDGSVPPPTAIGDEFTTDVMGNYRSRLQTADNVLDLGTGSGIIAVGAGLAGAREVTATDINDSSLTAVKVGWAVNGLPMDRLDARYSDGYNGIDADSSFDVTLANPPVQHETGLQGDSYLAYNEAGPDGRKVLDKVLTVGPDFTAEGGVIVTTASSRHGDRQTQRILDDRREAGDISEWNLIIDREIPLEERYRLYIPDWLQKGASDGDPRVFPTSPDKSGPTGYSHMYKVYELRK